MEESLDGEKDNGSSFLSKAKGECKKCSLVHSGDGAPSILLPVAAHL